MKMSKEEIKNPIIDAVYNERWSDLKPEIEKKTAKIIYDKIKKSQDEYLNKVRGI